VVHRPPQPAFDVPFVVAIIELDEGWFILSNVINCAVEDVRSEMRVSVKFVAISLEVALPCFEPARERNLFDARSELEVLPETSEGLRTTQAVFTFAADSISKHGGSGQAAGRLGDDT
jgi:hypothetical protein